MIMEARPIMRGDRLPLLAEMSILAEMTIDDSRWPPNGTEGAFSGFVNPELVASWYWYDPEAPPAPVRELSAAVAAHARRRAAC